MRNVTFRAALVMLLPLLVSCAFGQAKNEGDPDKELAAHWRFDEGSGTVLRDSSGNGNHGKIKGAKWVRNGKGFALEFDGIDDAVDCGDGLNIRSQVTMTAWVWVEHQPRHGEAGIIGKAYSSYVITQSDHSSLYSYINEGWNKAGVSMPFTEWIHVASTYDGNALKFYMNGRLVSVTPLEVPEIRRGGRFWMGRSDGEVKWTKDAHFHGRITDVRVYKRALIADEVAAAASMRRDNAVAVSVIPVPGQGRVMLKLDTRWIGRAPSAVQVKVFKQDGNGQAFAAALVTTSVGPPDGPGTFQTSLPMQKLESGQYVVRAVAVDAEGAPVGPPAAQSLTWTRVTFPNAVRGGKQLNNFVTELLRVPGPDHSGKAHPFINPRKGWIFISNHGTPQVKLTEECSDARIVRLTEKHRDAHETMRYLPEGNYTISAASAENLIVRAIPEIIYSYLGQLPYGMKYDDLYENEFALKHILPNVNTLLGGPCSTHKVKRSMSNLSGRFAKRGKKWLTSQYIPKSIRKNENATPDDAVRYFLALNTGPYDGMMADEFIHSHPECSLWAKAIDRAFSHPKLQGKVYYPFTQGFWDGAEGRELAATIVGRDFAIAQERYCKEMPSEADAWYYLNAFMARTADLFRTHCPGSVEHLIPVLFIANCPNEFLDTMPHVDYKTYIEMQFNLIATHPSYKGVRGVMNYTIRMADEETARWIFRCFRHYCIEGKAIPLSSDPYVLTHITNPGFTEGLKGWKLSPAEPKSIRAEYYRGFGMLQGRWPSEFDGGHTLVTRRCAGKANRFSQEITNLQPGRLYSLRMFTGDLNDMSIEGKHGIAIKIADVDIIPARSRADVFHNNRTHTFGPYNSRNKAWMNYHYRVFRARGATAKLTISDWASPDHAGGPIGRELMYNGIQVQPYFKEN